MPIEMCRTRVEQRAYDIPALFRSLLVSFFMVLATGALGMNLRAQTIRIKLVNGRNGHPMAQKCVNVGVAPYNHMLAIPTDKNGVAWLRFTDKDAEISIQNRWEACGDWGIINPVVKYAATIGINAGYVLCQPHTPGYSWLAHMTFSTKKVLESGVVTPNACGQTNASPEPGEIVVFVRPLNWREKLKE